MYSCSLQHGSQLLMNYESAKHSIATWDERDVVPGHSLSDLHMEGGANRWRDSTSSGDSSVGRRDSHASADSIKEGRRGSSRGSSYSGHDFVDNMEHCSYDTVIRRKSSGSESSNEHQHHRTPAKMTPNLPVTTEVTKQLSEQVAAHAQQRRSEDTLKRIKHGQSRSTDPPPPPPPAVSEVSAGIQSQQFPPPPSPLVSSPRRSVSTPKQQSLGDQSPFSTRVSDTPTGLVVGVVGRQQQEQSQQSIPPATLAKPPLPPDQTVNINASKHIGATSLQQRPPVQQHHPVSSLSGVHGAHIMNNQQGVQSVPNSPMHTPHQQGQHASLGHRRSGSTGAPPPAVAPKPKPSTPQRRDSGTKLPQPTEAAKPNFMEDLQRALAQKQAKSTTGPPEPSPKPSMSPALHHQPLGSPAHVPKPQHQAVRDVHYKVAAPIPKPLQDVQHQYHAPASPMSPGLENLDDLPPPPAELLEGLPKTNTPSLKKRPPPPPKRSVDTQLSSPRHQPHKPSS